MLLVAGSVAATIVSGCGEEVREAARSGTSAPTSPASETSKTKPGANESEPAATSDGSVEKSVAFPKLPAGAGPIDEDAPEQFAETDSGLRYRILRKSDGPKPNLDDPVVANYKGWFDNGQQFDSSYDAGKPIPFQVKTGVGGVIPGWVEGLQLIGVGGMIELEIPSELAYGARGHPAGIPPNTRLHFLIELMDIK
jgi:FKBP-type peptidyl-prolyl cis-trans isomerase